MVKITYIIVALFVHSCLCNDHMGSHYPFYLHSVGSAHEGYVYEHAKIGSKVAIEPIEGTTFTENDKEVTHLQVVVTRGQDHLNGTELFIVEDTEAFTIDKDGYIVVTNNTEFDHEEGAIEFFVVMFRDGIAVSNPVAFIVLVKEHKAEEEPTDDYNQAAAVFAGVLVCLIVVFALLIPFVVRAKRRLRHGKPIFKPGSHPANMEKALASEKGSQADLTALDQNARNFLAGRSMTEGDFYDNRGFRIEEEVERERDELSKDLLNIAKHTDELGDGNVIQLKKKHESDTDSGMSLETKSDRGKGDSKSDKRGILKNANGHAGEVYTIQDGKVASSKRTPNEETSHL